MLEQSKTKSTAYINDLIEIEKIKLQENNTLDFVTKISILSQSNGILESAKIFDNQQSLIASVGQNDHTPNRLSFSYSITKPISEYLSANFFIHDREYESIQLVILFSIFLVSAVFLISLAQIRHATTSAQHEFLKKIVTSIGNNEDIAAQFPALPEYLNGLSLISVKLKKLTISQEIANLATQVSHDIRSPLAALEMIASQIGDIPEDKRLIIRNSINRIRDIANSLTLKSEKKDTIDNDSVKNNGLNQSKAFETQSELLMTIIDLIVTEKRLQYRDQIGIQIEFNQSTESYGLFSKINTTEFKRVLSNIINNSVESFYNQEGKVLIELQTSANLNTIVITDNGRGIPQDILTKLGERGATFNKESGSGLGLFHAKTMIDSWGGRLELSSTQGIGTVVRILIPKQYTPSWFVPVLNLKKGTTIVVFDDDQSIHQIWKERLESFVNNQFKIFHFSSPNDLRLKFRKDFADLDEAVFLMDYEIIGHAESGLDLIEEFNIQKQAILVTSRFEDLDVRERCELLGVSLIPKSMSGFVPIQLV